MKHPGSSRKPFKACPAGWHYRSTGHSSCSVLKIPTSQTPSLYERCAERAERGSQLHIVMEHCEGGDLEAMLRGLHGRHMPEDELMRYFVQMALALHYIHMKNIIHRDVSSDLFPVPKSAEGQSPNAVVNVRHIQYILLIQRFTVIFCSLKPTMCS